MSLSSSMVNMKWIKERCAIPFFFLCHRVEFFFLSFLLYNFFSCSTHTHHCRLKCIMLCLKKAFFFFLRVRAWICECVCTCLVGTTALWAINDKIKERWRKEAISALMVENCHFMKKKKHVKWKKTFIALTHQTTGTKHWEAT